MSTDVRDETSWVMPDPWGPAESLSLWTIRQAQRLETWFGQEFALVSGETGLVLKSAADQPANDWDYRGILCRSVAERGRPVVIEEEDPLAVLAIPLAGPDGRAVVAVAAFVTRKVSADEPLSRAGDLLGLPPGDAQAWVARRGAWRIEPLMHLAEAAQSGFESQSKAERLEREVESLSGQIAATYEEITLLYRLTQNLKLSHDEDRLGRLALEWLAEVVHAESLVIQLFPSGVAGDLPQSDHREPRLLTFGRSLVDNDRLAALIDRLGIGLADPPAVRNRPVTLAADWPLPEISELVIAPLAEGTRLFGWIAAFNHQAGREFGTIEASLIGSVATILGIHAGNIDLYREQAQLMASVVRALSSAIDAKDPYTCGHSDRVARVAVRLARELGCDTDVLKTIYLAGLLHDVGKIGIDDNVLRKPDKLTPVEYEHIKTHARIGHRILRDIKQLGHVLPAVLHHHESWDGQGYPEGLAATEIPFFARIIAVADSFDAMASDRPYRQGMPDEKLDSIFREGKGVQWDPDVVDAFFNARNDVRQIVHHDLNRVVLDLRERV